MPVLPVEFHCHTIASKDSLVRPSGLVAAARRKGLGRVIVTDHNSIAGALRAQALAPELIIVGEEIMTTRGELLAAFVSELVPPDLAPEDAIRRLRDQGAFISVSHPFDRMRHGAWKETDLLRILPLVDAIEVYNSRCMRQEFNRESAAFAARHGVLGTVGSDAHAAFELGRSVLWLDEFQDAQGLRQALGSGRMQTRWSSPWIHLTSRYAVLRKSLPFGGLDTRL